MKKTYNLNLDCLQKFNNTILFQENKKLFWVVDSNYRLLQFNKLFQEYLFDNFGLTVSLGDSILSFGMDSELIEKWKGYYKTAFKGESFTVNESAARPKTSTLVDQTITIKPLYDLHSNIVGVHCDMQIDNDNNAEDQSESNLNDLIANLQDYENSLFIIEPKQDNTYQIVYVNNAFLALTDFEEQNILNKNIRDLVSPINLVKLREKYELVVKSDTNIVWQEQLSFSTQNPKVLINLNSVCDKNKEIFYLFGIIYPVANTINGTLLFENLEDVIAKTFKFSNDIICSINQNGEFLLVSDASVKILGYTPEELSGTKFINYVYEEDKIKTEKIEQIVHDGYSTSSFENRYVHKNGSLVDILWSAHWDYEEKKMYCVGRDITEYKSIIKKTEENEKLFNEAQRFSKMGSWNFNFKDDLLTWSDPLYEVFGVNKEEFDKTHDSFLDFIVPEDKDFVAQTSKKSQETGESFNINYRIKTPKGEIRIIEEFGYCEKDANNKIVRLFGTAQDVTERKKTEESLELSNIKYKYLFENNPLPLFVYDFKTLEIVDCNIETLMLYGYTREEFLNLTIVDIRPDEDKHLIIAATASEEIYGEIHKKNWRHKKKNGEVFYVDITGHLIEYDSRKCSLVFISDVTEKLRLEKKQKEYTQFIETTLENLPIGIAVNKINEGTATLMNQKFSEIYGWSKETLTNVSVFFEKVYPDKVYRDQIVEKIVADMQSKDPERMNWENIRITTENDGERIINAKNIPLYDQNLMISTVVDVTEKFNILKNLEESNERLQYATLATTDVIWDWNLDTDSIFWSERIHSLFGHDYSNSNQNGLSWFNIIHPEDYATVQQDLENTIHANTLNWTSEHRIVHGNGKISFVNQSAIIVRDDNEKAIRLVGSIQDISLRKVREQQLKLFESVVTTTNDAVLITAAEPFDNPGPKILFVNDAFTKLTGYTKEDVIGKTPRLLQGPKSDFAELKRLSKAIRDWKPCEITTINYDKAGNEFWVNFAVTPVTDNKGMNTHWISIQRDVTATKIEEQKRILINEISTIFNKVTTLQETFNELLKHVGTVFDYPAMGLWLLDEEEQVLNLESYYHNESSKINLAKFIANGVMHKYTEKGKGILGTVWEQEKIVEWSISNNDFTLFLEQETIDAGIRKVTAIPIIFNTVFVGTILIAREEENSRANDNIIVSQEVSLHLGAEIRRKQLEQELSKIFNFSPDVVCVINIRGKFNRINPVGCKLFGFEEKELLKMNITDLVFPDDFKNAKKKIRSLIKKEQTVYFENRFVTKDAVVKWMAWTASSTKDGLIYCVGKDITERKESENQLNLLNENLINQTQKLNISNEELEQFAYVASHDLQEPLRMVTSFLTLIEKKYHDKLDDKGLQYINFAVEGAKNMRQIILDLLNFSRIADNQDAYQYIDLSDIIKDVCSLQSKLINEKRAQINFENLPSIYSTRHYLIQLFQNLISNALKYSTEERAVQIDISSKSLKSHYLISVKDNGIGIEEEYFDKIFIIFQRLHTKEQFQGNGMGLAITKKIVEKLNGKIWVESEHGKGSTFYIQIPKKID